MKDEHLITAIHRALALYGTSQLPPDAADDEAHRSRRPRRAPAPRHRTPGWVSIGEIQAAQPPNSYPRLTRRMIKARCRELASSDSATVVEVRTLGLRTWVHVAPAAGPQAAGQDAAGQDAARQEPVGHDAAGQDVERTGEATDRDPEVDTEHGAAPEEPRDGG